MVIAHMAFGQVSYKLINLSRLSEILETCVPLGQFLGINLGMIRIFFESVVFLISSARCSLNVGLFNDIAKRHTLKSVNFTSILFFTYVRLFYTAVS